MKIILAGSLENPSSTVVFMKKALEELGQEIVPFDYREARRKLGNEQMQREMLELTRKENPDIFLLVKGEGISPDVVREIKKTCHVSLRYMDSPIPGWLVRLGRVSDSFFVTAGGLVRKYQKLGFSNVHHLWEGCDPNVHHYLESDSPDYQCEVAFIGTNKAGREQLLRQIKKQGIDLKIWGSPSWPDDLPYQGETKNSEDFARVCSGAKIILGLNDNNSIPDYFSDRAFLVLACRGFHLTSYTPGMEKWFTNKENLAWFKLHWGWKNRYRECLDLIKYYLKNPEERQRIARSGQEHVYANYTWKKNMGKMLNVLSELCGKKVGSS